MDWHLLWKAAIIVIGGTILLRIAGRKSISQMTLAQTVIMVGIGSLLVQPLVGKNVWSTLAVGLILIATLVVLELLQLKSDLVESFITGKAKILIQNGEINKKNLIKLRLTVDQLEMQLRQKNVANISDILYATLEPNGQLGYTLKQSKQPATKEDLTNVLNEIEQLKSFIDTKLPSTKIIYKVTGNSIQSSNSSNKESQENKQNKVETIPSLFEEVKQRKHQSEPPKYLQ